jgi:hypothetical protein
VNLLNFTRVPNCTKMKPLLLLLGLTVLFTVNDTARADWTIDLSRRQKDIRKADLGEGRGYESDREPASTQSSSGTGSRHDIIDEVPAVNKTAAELPTRPSLIERVLDPGETVQDVVILNTEKGFVPSTVRIRKDGKYRIHVVNVNEKEKNVSFMLDAFSEHHATFYGKMRSFNLEAKKEGIYSFQSPETSAEGRLIVFSPQITVREPASNGTK